MQRGAVTRPDEIKYQSSLYGSGPDYEIGGLVRAKDVTHRYCKNSLLESFPSGPPTLQVQQQSLLTPLANDAIG